MTGRAMRRISVVLIALLGLGVLTVLAVPRLTAGPATPADRPIPPLTLAPEAPLRLAVMGTSLTATYDWPETLAFELQACLERPVVLLREAVAGMNSDWGVTRGAEVIAMQPDIVVIEFAINDADIRDGTGLSRGAANHRALLAELAAGLPSARLALMTMSPAYELPGMLRPLLGMHYAGYRRLAEELEIGLIDLDPRWRARPRDQQGLQRDGLHPDRAVVETVLLPPLRQAVGAALGVSCA